MEFTMCKTYVCNGADPVRIQDTRLKIVANALTQVANELATSDSQDDQFQSQVLQEHAYQLHQERIRLAGGDAPAANAANGSPLGLPKIDWSR
jgi:hypothetical protein